MAELYLSGQSNKPGSSEVILISGDALTGYKLHEWALGDVAWELHWSGQRGTLGAELAGATPQNRPLVIDLRVTGTDADDLAEKQAVVYTLGDELRRFGGRVTVRLKDATHRVHFDVKAGTIAVQHYDWAHIHKHTVIQRLEALCAPYLLGDPMDVVDDFSEDRLYEYTYDAGAAGDLVVVDAGSGVQFLDAAANFTTEKRLIHTAYGYDYGDHQATVRAWPGSTLTSFKAGVVLKRLSATDYLLVFVSDNGTSSALYIGKVVAGAYTQLATSAISTRIAGGSAFWVRGRIEGDVVTAEYFTGAAAPTEISTPTHSATHALSGAEATSFGASATGKGGLVLTPQHSNAMMDNFALRPYTYRSLSLPQEITLRGAIPGDAPALATLEVSFPPTGDAPFALVGWAKAGSPFGLIEAESGSPGGGWAVTADADYRGGSGLQVTAAGAVSTTASFAVDLALADPDDYGADVVAIEVWARAEVASTLVNPKLTLKETSGPRTIYSQEFGSVGRSVTKPSSGTAFRFVRLGVLVLQNASATVTIAATADVGSTGVFGLDYVLVVPAKRRALSPTGKLLDGNYPKFRAGVGGILVKQVRPDLSALSANESASPSLSDIGLGGALLEVLPGDAEFYLKLSSLVPDDPVASASSEALANTASVHLALTPRWHLARAS